MMTTAEELLGVAWAPLLQLADSVDETGGWTATRLPGWTTRDLLFHLAGDTQRGGTRTIASQWSSFRGPAELFSETARAALQAARTADPTAVVGTQGRALRIDALLRTLVIEAAVHHLDLEPVLADRPADIVLAEVRRVLDALLGQPAPTEWDDARWARLGTGRVAPDQGELDTLAPSADRLPLFG